MPIFLYVLKEELMFCGLLESSIMPMSFVMERHEGFAEEQVYTGLH